MEALRLCIEQKEIVCRILSYHTFNRKEDIFDHSKIEQRCELFASLDNEQLSTLFMLVLSGDHTEDYIIYFGIDKERQERNRISSIKNDNSTLFFGGHTIYGTLIDFVCQRYGWTMDYVVWGISYANLKMLIADAITTIYLSDTERKQLGINLGEVVNADDPKNRELIRQMLKE